MWEGEPIGAGGSPTGDYIIDLKSGTWGASGSTYDVGNCGGSNTSCTATNVVAVAVQRFSGRDEQLGLLSRPGSGLLRRPYERHRASRSRT